jgi:hypothetical protein
MALSDAEVIYNLSLSRIGDYRVTEGDTTSKGAVSCIRHYTDAQNEVLESHPWNFAKKDVILYEYTDRPIFGYDRKYAKPSDCVRVLTVDNSIGSDVSRKQAGVPAWEVKGDYIHSDAGAAPPSWSSAKKYYAGQFVTSSSITYEVLVTHTSDATGANEAAQIAVDVAAGNIESKGGDYEVVYVEYLWKQVDMDKWSALAKNALVVKLASKVITDLYADSDERRESLIKEFEALTGPQARSADAAEGKPRPIFRSSWLAARQSGSTGDYYVT